MQKEPKEEVKDEKMADAETKTEAEPEKSQDSSAPMEH